MRSAARFFIAAGGLSSAIHADTEHLAPPGFGCRVVAEEDVQPMAVDGAAGIDYRHWPPVVITWNADTCSKREQSCIGRDKTPAIVANGFATGGYTVCPESTADLTRAVSGDFHPDVLSSGVSSDLNGCQRGVGRRRDRGTGRSARRSTDRQQSSAHNGNGGGNHQATSKSWQKTEARSCLSHKVVLVDFGNLNTTNEGGLLWPDFSLNQVNF